MSFVPRTVALRLGARRATVQVAPDGTMTISSPPSSSEATSVVSSVRVHYLGHGRVQLEDAEGRLPAYAVDEGTRRWVFLDGDVFLVDLDVDAARAGRRRGGGAPESLSAPMPATVVKVMVAAGSRVAKGDTLVVLEAMKMELPLKAPHDALVTDVRCAEGELVEPGVVLVELKEIEGAEGAEGAEEEHRKGAKVQRRAEEEHRKGAEAQRRAED